MIGAAGTLPSEIGSLSSLKELTIIDKEHSVTKYPLTSGYLPDLIGNLTKLYFINLAFTNIRGPIPSSIGNNWNLTTLSLWTNREINGSIPSSIGNLKNLEYLNLDSCSISGTIPPIIGDLSKLEYLWLGNNNITGTIPPEIGKLIRLKSLVLARNKLIGNVPSSLSKLSLNLIYLSENNLTGCFDFPISSRWNCRANENPGLCSCNSLYNCSVSVCSDTNTCEICPSKSRSETTTNYSGTATGTGTGTGTAFNTSSSTKIKPSTSGSPNHVTEDLINMLQKPIVLVLIGSVIGVLMISVMVIVFLRKKIFAKVGKKEEEYEIEQLIYPNNKK